MTRRGFSLVELSVVIVLANVASCVVAQAIQQMWVDAYQKDCVANLRKLYVALEAYSQHHGEQLPPAWASESEFPGSGPRPSWGFRLLPYLEETREVPTKNPARLFSRQVDVFRCPSEDAQPVSPLRGNRAIASYVAVAGAAPMNVVVPRRFSASSLLIFGPQPMADRLRGPFGLNLSAKFDSIRDGDGLANTLLLGERSARDGAAVGDNAIPDDVLGDCAPGSEINGLLGTGFSSWHPSGANFLVADGSVRLVAQTIESKLVAKGKGEFVLGVYQQLGAFADSRD